MSGLRVAVVGTGAVGGSVAADIARAGIDVMLVDQWPDHVEAMRAHGLRIDTPVDSTVVPVRALHLCEVATLRQPFDLVFVGVKAYDTRWACELIRPYLAQDGLVVGLQNGMTMDVIASVAGPERTLGCVVEIAANCFTPGRIERQVPREGTWFALGAYDGSTRHRVAAAAEVLGCAGTVEQRDDVRSAKWMKLVANSSEFLPSSILNLPLGEAIRVPGIRDLMDAAGRESLQVALALDQRIVPMFGKPGIEKLPQDAYSVALLDAIVAGWTLKTTRVAPLQDWLKGRHNEVDEINGRVVDEAARLGFRVPANELLVETAHRIERGELPFDPANAEWLVAEWRRRAGLA